MGFKDLIGKAVFADYVSEEEPKTVTPKQVVQSTKFPSAQTEVIEPEPVSKSMFGFSGPVSTTPTFSTTISDGVINAEHLEKAIELYQSGFDNLNQPGFDFYEYYQLVMNGGVTNPQIYTMAFTMANTMDKLVTKVSLISQSDFYISEITKQYDGFVSKGNLKKEELEQQKTNENQSLVSELNTMREQLEAIKVQINDREKKLSAIGSKYDPLLNDVNSKLSANTQAKNLITQSIEQVKQGINNNLK